MGHFIFVAFQWRRHHRMTWHIDLDRSTATSVNGITFKLTEVRPGLFEWICTNPKNIPSDDLDDEILGKMVDEANEAYEPELSNKGERKWEK